MKKLLLLGGSKYLLPAIKAAHELGVYVITCDYLPDNIAHQYSDEYHNVSIVDKEAVLDLARTLEIDGIMSYATDPGVIVAAYVAEKLGLPGCPYESVRILQNKGLFRSFLKKHNFNVPTAKSFSTLEQAMRHVDDFQWPVIVKPVDSAGSKGVTRVDEISKLPEAVCYAKEYSLTDTFIIEEFIEKTGASTDTDSFSVNGELVFCSFNDQWFDPIAANPYTPSAYLWPCTMSVEAQKELRNELQRLMKLLNMTTTIYNIETRLGKDGKPYIMEMTPRAGGNRLSEVLKYACGQDLVIAAVKGALGMEVQPLTDPIYDGWWGECILHSNEEGIYHKLNIAESLQRRIIELDLWVKEGEQVHSFTGANEAIGTIIIRCESSEELHKYIEHIDEYVRVCVK
ncbi:ATP-grasp domain-containing protein [Blautia argi]|uniref:ATP-grasp domain-containing protein n=1 Tax=Blautia argi TaxID=1912897 RepID=UPI00294346A9|nr:ATP-grasp domain-containing protein [Blautia argi]